VKKFERLDAAKTPDGTVLTLYRHDGAYFIWADSVELMSTRRHQSEEKLGELVCAPYHDTPKARALIGGLGFGFTLVAALRALGDDAHVVVAEIVPEVITWYSNPEYQLAGDTLRDPRVEIRLADVAKVLRDSPGTFDAIMLDTDNGAESLTTAGNDVLYHDAGIQTAVAALRPGGTLAYWLAGNDRSFERALRRAGLNVEVTAIRAHTTSGGRHTLFIARQPERKSRVETDANPTVSGEIRRRGR
jgi:spermidine synthase